MTDQKLLRTFKKIVYKKEDLPKEYLRFREEVNKYWEVFKKENPHSVREPKLRINSFEFDEEKLVISLSEGIDFADVIYTNWAYTSKQIPSTPEDTYLKVSDLIWKTDVRFSNAAAVGAIVVFNGSSPKFVFAVRSKKMFGGAGTISLPVNGYADPIDGSGDILLDNLYKETKEEIFIQKEEIEKVSFVGPAQMRGKSCDLIWIIQPKISYEYWLSRWQGNLSDEFKGIVSYKLDQIGDLFTNDINKIFPFITMSVDQKIKDQSVKLNSLLESLKHYLLEEIH